MDWLDFTLALISPPFWGGFWSMVEYRRLDRRYVLRIWMFVAVGSALLAAVPIPFLHENRSGITGHIVSAIVCAILRWWDSGQRKRAAKLLGAKARAVREAMARRMRQLPRRPVLVPS